MKPIIENFRDITDSKEMIANESNPFAILFLYLLLGILVIAFLWSYFGEIDEYVKATGVIRPNNKISSVQNVTGGKVVKVAYEEGQSGKKGDILNIIGHEKLIIEQDNNKKELQKLTTELKNLKLLRASYLNGENFFIDLNGSEDFEYNSYNKMRNMYLKYKYQAAQLESIVAQKKELHQDAQKLFELSAGRAKDIKMTKYELEYSIFELEKFKTESLAEIEKDIIITESSLDKLQKEINQDEVELENVIVRAPIDGVVNVLTEVTQGDYLPSNTKILNIVPADNLQYKIIMQVNNKDIAQVKEGQVVYYEFLALPYKEYGNFKGTITKVGIDSSIEEKNPTKSYLVEANIEHKAVFNQKGEQGDLKVGMNCDVRIVTKSKKIINYLLEKINLRE